MSEIKPAKAINNWRVGLPWPECVTAEHFGPVEYLYEDKEGKTVSRFERDEALAALLLSETVFLSSNWSQDAWPADAKNTVAICVNTNDVFAWGCADAEEITYAEIEEVYRCWAKDPNWGAAVWAMIRNKEMPQRPVAEHIRKGGIWDLDALQREHGLRANLYDGLSGVFAQRKRCAYEAWCVETGRTPLPHDGGWWAGWREYTEANPGWYDDAWKAADEAAKREWQRANGWLSTGSEEPTS